MCDLDKVDLSRIQQNCLQSWMFQLNNIVVSRVQQNCLDECDKVGLGLVRKS